MLATTTDCETSEQVLARMSLRSAGRPLHEAPAAAAGTELLRTTTEALLADPRILGWRLTGERTHDEVFAEQIAQVVLDVADAAVSVPADERVQALLAEREEWMASWPEGTTPAQAISAVRAAEQRAARLAEENAELRAQVEAAARAPRAAVKLLADVRAVVEYAQWDSEDALAIRDRLVPLLARGKAAR